MHPGSWGKDTTMAVALASSLIECGGWNDKDFAERLAAWLTHGEYSCSGSPGLFHGGLRSGCEWLAPVAIRFWQDRQALGAAAIGQARVGRASAPARWSGWFLAEMLADAIAGELPGKLPRYAGILKAQLGDTGAGWTPSASGEFGRTLASALVCVEGSANYKEAVHLALDCQDGAVAVITGQLAGAIYGLAGIPEGWLHTLAWREPLEALALELTTARGWYPG